MSENLITKALGKKISRRSFVKWTSAVGATSALSGLVVSQAAKVVGAASKAPLSTTVVDWVPTNCLVCHSWCRIAVGKNAAGNIVKIEGAGGQPRTDAFGQGWSANSDVAAGYRNWQNDDTYNRYCQTIAGQLPYSVHNRGRICAKGNDGMEHTYDPNRVKYPMIRAAKRGAGKWRRITWNQLYFGDPNIYLDNGAGRLFPWTGIAKIVRNMGTTSVAAAKTATPYYDGLNTNLPDNGQPDTYFDEINDASGTATRRTHRMVMLVGRNESDNAHGTLFDGFARSVGTPNYVEHTNLCESSRHTAQILQQKDKFPMMDSCIHGDTNITWDTQKKGSGATAYTLSGKDDCDLLILHGGNLAECMIPHASLAQRAADIRRNGGRIVNIDVRQSNTGAWADEELFLKSGTDAALGAGIINKIMTQYRGGSAGLRTRLLERSTTGAQGGLRWKGIFASDEAPGNILSATHTVTGGAVILAGVLTGSVSAASGSAFTAASTYSIGLSVAASGDRTIFALPSSGFTATNQTAASGTFPAIGSTLGTISGSVVLAAGTTLAIGSKVTYDAVSINATDKGALGGLPAWTVDGTPVNKSLESYVLGNLPEDPASGASGKDTAWVLAQCGGSGVISETNITDNDLMYLGWALSDNYGWGNTPASAMIAASGSTTVTTWLAASGAPLNGVRPPRNPIVDGYRGPSKHSNGAYSYFVLRALQTIACGHDDGTSNPAVGGATERAARAGGVNRVGGLVHDAWNASWKQTGLQVTDSNAGNANSTGPDKRETGQRIDNWDYHGYGGEKWKAATHKVYSNLLVGARASVGLHPFKDGVTLVGEPVANVSPYGASPGNGLDTNFTTELLFNHKSNARFSTPGAAADGELFTAVGDNGYRLKYVVSSDLVMGGTTMFADVIVPDTSYLERYVFNWHETPACTHIMGMRQPVWQDASGINLYLYRDTSGGSGPRPIRQFLHQWARAVEADTIDPQGNVTALTTGAPGWSLSMFNTWNWDINGVPVTGLGAGVGSFESDRAWAKVHYQDAGATGTPQVGGSSFNYMRTNGFFESPESYSPYYWRSSAGGNLIEVYNAGLDATTDPTTGNGTTTPKETGKQLDNTFFGTAIYDPIRKQGGFTAATGSMTPSPATGRYNMTTYKVNVHTQARTASCPRLAEIIGQNWAVMAEGSKDTAGTTIKNGDKVQISALHRNIDGTRDTTIVRKGVWEAKISKRASNKNVVSISQSFGHDIGSFGGDGLGGVGWQVSEDGGATYGPSLSGYVPSAPSTRYDDANRVSAPVAANRGTDVTWVMSRGGEDPIGASVAYFDTMVEVTIIT